MRRAAAAILWCKAWRLAWLVLLLASCSASPFKAGDSERLQQQARLDNRVVVYIYRSPGGVPGRYPQTVAIDGKPLGQLVSDGYFAVLLAPGEHVISTPSVNKAEVALKVAKGETYYVSQEIIPANPPYVLLNRVEESIGKPYIERGRRLCVRGYPRRSCAR